MQTVTETVKMISVETDLVKITHDIHHTASLRKQSLTILASFCTMEIRLK